MNCKSQTPNKSKIISSDSFESIPKKRVKFSAPAEFDWQSLDVSDDVSGWRRGLLL